MQHTHIQGCYLTFERTALKPRGHDDAWTNPGTGGQMQLGSAHMLCLKQMPWGGVEWSFQALKEGEGAHAARLLPPGQQHCCSHAEVHADPLMTQLQLTELLSCT